MITVADNHLRSNEMNPEKAYDWLRDNSVETAYMVSAAQVLAWDQRTYMPGAGHAHRAEQMAIMAKLLHGRTTDSLIGERLADVEGSDMVADPLSAAAVNVREWRRDYDRSARIPQKLAMDLARETAQGESVWEAARPRNDWDAFVPHLARIVTLLREKASALGYENEPYDALLDEYEPGETAEGVRVVFDSLREGLVDLLDRIRGSARKPDESKLKGNFDIRAQKMLTEKLVADIGYDLAGGRVDVAAHPFTIGIGPGDVRITTRFDREHFGSALFGSLHEAGHGIYEQGLPGEHWGTPRGSVASLGIHESQSRMWENIVGRSRAFWEYGYGVLEQHLGPIEGADLDTLVLAINSVKPSLIRVEADEITYNLHILLRFELELALVRGELAAGDLPDAWNQKMRDYLGVIPPDVSAGVMQDVHWSAGLIGYFPTYTLGNLYAAQMFRKADDDLGGLAGRFSKGDFAPLLQWLREHVHEPGGTYRPRDLVRRITGEELDSGHFTAYCEAKYGSLYDL